jgi:hypothetical protein
MTIPRSLFTLITAATAVAALAAGMLLALNAPVTLAEDAPATQLASTSGEEA